MTPQGSDVCRHADLGRSSPVSHRPRRRVQPPDELRRLTGQRSSGENFLYVIKGTPPARRAVPALGRSRAGSRRAERVREAAGGARQELGGAAGLLGDSGAAACPRPTSGSPPVAGTAAAPTPRTRRQAAQAATFPERRASTDGQAVLLAPGSRSPRKITAQRVCGASLTRWRKRHP